VQVSAKVFGLLMVGGKMTAKSYGTKPGRELLSG